MTTQQATCGHDRPGNCSTLAKCGAQPRKAVSAPPRGSRQPTFRPFRPCLACWNGARSPSEAGIRGISVKGRVFRLHYSYTGAPMVAVFHAMTAGRMRSRGTDNYGSGQHGASRGGRSHAGLDIVTRANEVIFSPIDGEVIREAFPYHDGTEYRGILIKGTGDYNGYEIKLFYVNGLLSGPVKAGGLIGHAQNLAVKYPGITNHVHLEIYRNGVPINPVEAFRMCF